MVMDPLPVPVVGETVAQVALEDADQVVFDVTVSDVDAVDADGIDQLDVLRVNDGVTAVESPG